MGKMEAEGARAMGDEAEDELAELKHLTTKIEDTSMLGGKRGIMLAKGFNLGNNIKHGWVQRERIQRRW